MEIEGKIIFATEPRSGVSSRTGSAWKAQDFVIETHEQVPRKCCFTVFGTDRLSMWNIQIGEELRVSFEIDAHEYNGRWYNSVRAWKVERIDQATAQTVVNTPSQPAGAGAFMSKTPLPAQPSATNQPQSGSSDDDLPF